VIFVLVLERRSEIGLCRALGSTRVHIAVQFFAESLLLSGLGGCIGVAAGVTCVVTYAAMQGWSVLIPAQALCASLGVALLIGVAAELHPALRALKLSPTESLRSA
jgi:putative ABC transport system permease protein